MATLNDSFSTCCTLLQPIYECHSKQVFETNYLQIDVLPKWFYEVSVWFLYLPFAEALAGRYTEFYSQILPL